MSEEVRNLMEPVEFRAEGKALFAYGYAARFNTTSQNLGGFVERIAPGTFAKTLQEADVRALFNHDPNLLLGRNKVGTLTLAEDSTGLAYEVELPDTSVGRDLAVLLERGDVSGSSFGFRTITDEWAETDSGFPERTLTSVALRDVGPVTFPAYVDADSAIRSLAESRSLDVNDLLAAAKADKLSEALRAEDEEGSETEQEEDQATPILIHRSGLIS